MTVKILSLYPDLMNLYGSNGNLRCLKKHIEAIGFETEIVEHISDQTPDFSDIDFVYIGAGTERSRDRALRYLLGFKNEFLDYVEKGGVCLFCGNSFELLGKSISKNVGETQECLSLFKFESFMEERRSVVDTVCTCPFLEKEIIGFMNKQSYSSIVTTPLFRVLKGMGNAKDRNDEGAFYKNLFATSLAGPILVRNPHFREFIEKKIYENKKVEAIPKSFENELEAYERSLNGLTK